MYITCSLRGFHYVVCIASVCFHVVEIHYAYACNWLCIITVNMCACIHVLFKSRNFSLVSVKYFGGVRHLHVVVVVLMLALTGHTSLHLYFTIIINIMLRMLLFHYTISFLL